MPNNPDAKCDDHAEPTIANRPKMPKNKKRGSRQAVMFTGAVYPASPGSEQE
jgi:hypothetical protein